MQSQKEEKMFRVRILTGVGQFESIDVDASSFSVADGLVQFYRKVNYNDEVVYAVPEHRVIDILSMEKAEKEAVDAEPVGVS